MRKFLILILILTALVPSTFSTAQSGSDNITFQFVNLTSNPVDLYRNGNVVFFGNRPTVLSAQRVLIESSEQTFQVYSANATTDPLAELTFTPEAGQTFLLIASQTGDTVQLTVLERDQQAVTANRARLEILNLAANPMPLTLVGQNNDILIQGIAPADLVRADIPAGNYQTSFRDIEDQELFARAINATAGSLVTLVLYGDDTFRTFEVKDNLDTLGEFRFVHAMRLTSAVDVYFDDELTFTDIAYQDVTDYAPLPAGTYNVTLFPAGEISDQPLWTGEVKVDTNAPLTGVAFGENTLRLITHLDDHLQIRAGEARMRFINVALNLPQLTVQDGDGEIIAGEIEYALGTRNIVQTARTQTLVFRETGGEEYVTLSDFVFSPNHTYTFIVVGNALIDGNITVLTLDWNWKQ